MMKIIKYPQSCFMVEAEGKNVLVDPGSLSFEGTFEVEWSKADFVLITHKHADHCFEQFLAKLNCPIFASKEVQNEYPNLRLTIVKEGDVLNLAENINLEVVKAFHGYIPWLKNKAEVLENIGHILSVEGKKIYFTSDTICFKNDYKCDILCAPVSGHGLVMSAFEVSLFAKECGAGLVLPCHMDNPKFPVDVEKLKKTFEEHEINYHILKTRDAIEM